MSQYNTKSVKLQGYQSIHLQSTSVWESVSSALVQIKVTTGEMERQKHDNPQEESGFACGGLKQLLSPYPSWLILL